MSCVTVLETHFIRISTRKNMEIIKWPLKTQLDKNKNVSFDINILSFLFQFTISTLRNLKLTLGQYLFR